MEITHCLLPLNYVVIQQAGLQLVLCKLFKGMYYWSKDKKF